MGAPVRAGVGTISRIPGGGHEPERPDSLAARLACPGVEAVSDRTWSAIGSSLWHLATHDEDRRRLVADSELLPLTIEELLRAHSPVTMGRIVTGEVEYGGCPMHERRPDAEVTWVGGRVRGPRSIPVVVG